MTAISRIIPESVLRGIQLALALLLLKTAAEFLLRDPFIFALAALVILTGLLLTLRAGLPDLSAIIVVGIGLLIGITLHGFPGISRFEIPALVIPTMGDAFAALTELVLPQAILTITNAILATSLLTKDLFRSEVQPAKLSRTIGIMNLTSVPFGGFPMCHGAGGLAGQYRFGARTGAANIFAGLFFLTVALFFAGQQALALIPVGIFGALLLFAAIELGKHGLTKGTWPIAAVMGTVALASSMTVAFIVGMVLAYGFMWYGGRRETQ
jgi:MFS superfamily sulfate permease-like transporter